MSAPPYIIGALYRTIGGELLKCFGPHSNGYWRFVDAQGRDDFADDKGCYNNGTQFLERSLRPYELVSKPTKGKSE